MKHLLNSLLLVSACWLALSCIERSDYDHQASLVPPAQLTEHWEKAGEFGGTAEVAVDSSDPWAVRFTNGGFKQVSGVCATGDEVWVCDLDISRIQVFGFDGRFRRSIGRGMPIEGTLISLEDLYEESVDFDRDTDVSWEQQFGNVWRANRRELFRVGDVVVRDGGYWVADWAKTSTNYRTALRDFSVYFVPEEGDIKPVEINGLAFPSYLVVSDSEAAVSSPTTTGLWAMTWEHGTWSVVDINSGATFQRYMQMQQAFSDSGDYMNIYGRMTGSGRDIGQYFLVSGLAIAYEKLVICDTGNQRIQVLNLNKDKDATYAMFARVVHGGSGQAFRFEAPLDIDIAKDGRIFVLDKGRLEVAVLDVGFNRIGSFGKGDLVEPYALDLSDDGRHCFVTDRYRNMVFHYAAAD